jgi:hypothetical protein
MPASIPCLPAANNPDLLIPGLIERLWNGWLLKTKLPDQEIFIYI